MTALLASSLLFLVALPCGAEESTAAQLVARLDSLYRSESSYSHLEMVVITPHWERRLELEMWTQGMERTFIRVVAPRKEEGTATLRIGREMWNYFPRIDKVMRVPPSMMMGSWMGSDFTNDDLVEETSLLEEYRAQLLEADNREHYCLELRPREAVVRREDLLPVREVYYEEGGRAMRRMEFSQVRDFGGRRLPALIEVAPLHKQGQRTLIRYLEARFGVELEEGVFTLRNLRRR